MEAVLQQAIYDPLLEEMIMEAHEYYLAEENVKLAQVPQILPLQSTPFHEIEITDPEGHIPLLAEQYPDHEQALVRYILHWDSATQDRERYCREIEAIFPRWYDRVLKDTHSGVVTEASLISQMQ
jgi:DNA repair protein SbcD/Mre11